MEKKKRLFKIVTVLVYCLLFLLPFLLASLMNSVESGPKIRIVQCFWWGTLVLIYALVLAYMAYFERKLRLFAHIFWGLFLGIALYAVHWILHDFYIESKACDWFGVFELVIMLAYIYFLYRQSLGIDKSNALKNRRKQVYKLS